MKVIFLIYFCCCVNFCYGWRPYEVRFSNLSCYSFDINNSLSSTLNADGSLNAEWIVSKNMPEMLYHIELYLDSGSGKYEMELLNKTINLCRLFREPRYEPLFQIIYKMILQYSNYPTKCPIPKNKYRVRRMRINTELLPPMLPEKNGVLRINC